MEPLETEKNVPLGSSCSVLRSWRTLPAIWKPSLKTTIPSPTWADATAAANRQAAPARRGMLVMRTIRSASEKAGTFGF